MANKNTRPETEEQKLTREAAENEAAEKEAADKKTAEDAAKKKGKEGDDVSLPKKTLEAILSRMEGQDEVIKQLQEKDAKREKEVEMLKSISDKARLARYESQQQGPLIRTARVSFWEGKPVLAWMKVKDEVGFRDGRLIVSQVVRLFLDDVGENGEPRSVDLDYLYWAQNSMSEEGEVVECSETTTGNFWTIQLKDGRKIKVDIRFINAF